MAASEPQQSVLVKPKVGVSACLIGEEVRFNGGHKRDNFVSGPLSQFIEFVSICPEVGIGMGVPRPPIRLLGSPERPRAVGVDDPTLDVTDRLEDYARGQARDLGDISGYVLKKDSPSCGMERVKLYAAKGAPSRKATGVYTRILMEQLPLLPLEEEGRLNDPVLRENFVNRVFVYQRWQQLVDEGLSPAALIGFHTDHKFLVMAHSQASYKRLGRLLSDLAGSETTEIGEQYIGELMATLKRRVDRKRHSNVLQHIMGYLKRSIDSGDKAELLQTIDDYRGGRIPLIVPITLLRHYLRRHPDPYMQRQHYLQPHPEALSLRNAI